ncbi:hypothetical protein ABK040_006975 [Willaertia magna]
MSKQEDFTKIINSSNFPPEIINYIFSYLKIDLSFILKLSSLNKQLYNFFNEHSFWKDNLNKFNLLTTKQKNFTTNFKQIYAILNRYLYLQKLKAQSAIKIAEKNSSIKSPRIAIIGNGGCGKSTLVSQFVQNVFPTEYDPTIEDVYKKHYKFNNQSYLLQILDTAGPEEYLSLQDQYSKTCEGFIFVISMLDINNSFERFSYNLQKIIRVKEAFSFPAVVCVMKTDAVMEWLNNNLDEFNKLKQKITDFIENHNVIYRSENIPLLFVDGHKSDEVENVFQKLIEKFEMMDGMLKVSFDCKEFTDLVKLVKKNENDRDLLFEVVVEKFNLANDIVIRDDISTVDKKKCLMM